MITYYRLLSESPNMRKISLMLKETALPHEISYIEPQEEAQDSLFLTISPNGTLPAIVDSETGVSLFESTAILYYLAEKSGALIPAEIKQRAEVMKWLAFEAANVCPAVIELHHYFMHDMGDIPESVYQRYKDKLGTCCAILDKQLENQDYLAGDYSIADIALFPWTVTLEDIADVRLANFPHLARWAERMNNR